MNNHTAYPVPRQESAPKFSLKSYTLERPSGYPFTVTANAAAIAPLLRQGWIIVSVKEAK